MTNSPYTLSRIATGLGALLALSVTSCSPQPAPTTQPVIRRTRLTPCFDSTRLLDSRLAASGRRLPEELSLQIGERTVACEDCVLMGIMQRDMDHDATVTLRLATGIGGVEAALHYRPVAAFRVLERWLALRNAGTEPITSVSRCDSIAMTFGAPRGCRIGWVDGAAATTGPTSAPHVAPPLVHRLLGNGESLAIGHEASGLRVGIPWAMIEFPDEQRGVYLGLEWPGPWRMRFEQRRGAVHVVAGAAALDANLKPDEHLDSPHGFVGLFVGDADAAMQALHTYVRGHLRRRLPNAFPPVRCAISWDDARSATTLTAELAAARAIGVELVLVDMPATTADREDDWKRIAAQVRDAGFGLGVHVRENELPTSQPTTAPADAIATAVLDLMDDARIDAILLSTDPAVAEDEQDDRAELERLCHALPGVAIDVSIDSSQSIDVGLLRNADAVSFPPLPYDGSSTLSWLAGVLHVLPAESITIWLAAADAGQSEAQWRTRVRCHMLTGFGIADRIRNWPPAFEAIARDEIARYQQHRDLLRGDLFLLLPESPSADGEPSPAWIAFQFTGLDRREAIVYTFADGSSPRGPVIRLRGLRMEGRYRVRIVDDKSESAMTGEQLAEIGVALPAAPSRSSWVVRIEPSPQEAGAD